MAHPLESIVIRHLVAEDPDVEELIRGALIVKNAGWRDTYANCLSTDYLDAMDARIDADVEAWKNALVEGRLLPTWVAVAHGASPASTRVVGVGAGHPVDVPHDRGRLGGGTDGADVEQELSVLYVDAARRGQGIAERLAHAVIGDASACLWVLEENPRARGFYSKIGFEPDGAVEDLPAEWSGAREIRMVRH